MVDHGKVVPFSKNEEYGAAETARRRDAIIKRMIATPPTPHAPLKSKKAPSRSKRTTAKAKKSA